MPLSKAGMRARKRQDRFDKQHLSPYQAKPVKPNMDRELDFSDWENLPKQWTELDADGQPMYDE